MWAGSSRKRKNYRYCTYPITQCFQIQHGSEARLLTGLQRVPTEVSGHSELPDLETEVRLGYYVYLDHKPLPVMLEYNQYSGNKDCAKENFHEQQSNYSARAGTQQSAFTMSEPDVTRSALSALGHIVSAPCEETPGHYYVTSTCHSALTW